jgi:uncharacterized protein (DUF488 family)
MPETIYTIGHSNHSLEHFLALLQQHGIGAVCDVRSKPYSRMNPQFNRENLSESLGDVNIRYVFLGRELGARSENPACYVEGKVQYDLLAKTGLFRSGIERVLDGVKKYRIALMCAEKDPLDCHRTVLVSRELEALGLPVDHILADGSLERHGDVLIRLREKLHLPESDLFRSPQEVMEDAYRMQAARIAYEADELAGGASD